jgi:two-component system response regulator RegA
MKLLIIEDDEVLANITAMRLKKHDFECYIANDASKALLLARSVLPQYILLDMKLHEVSGLQLISPLRSLLPTARIILLTGFASIATAVDAIKLGADDYLAKPADSQTIMHALLGRKISTEIVEQETVLSPEQVEWQHLQQVLKHNQGNISATARQLGMHRRTLQRKLQKRPIKRQSVIINNNG